MAPPQPSTFGMLLRRHRVDAGLTQEELAERALISARAISDLERGVNRGPRYHTVRHLVNALELSPAERGSFEALAHDLGGRADMPDLVRESRPSGNFLGAIPRGRFIGRERERERILSALDVVHQGEGRMVVITGEPGIGKTRLSQEIALEIVDRRFLVATGRCFASEQTVPFHPFLEALAMFHQAAPRSVREAIPHRWPYLGRIVTGEGGTAGLTTDGGQEEQQRLLRAVTGFVTAMAESRPLALMLDDLHWADDASLNLLLHLARHTRASSLMLLGTFRAVQSGGQHALEEGLLDLQREGLIEAVTLARLNEGETAEFVAARLDDQQISPHFAELVFARTQGNPFFLDQVLRNLVERGDVYRAGECWRWQGGEDVVAPETVMAVVRQRISHLSTPAQDMLHAASVLGLTFLFDDLARMAHETEEKLEESLEEARGAGLLRYEGDDRYAFDHPLTLEALYEEIAPRRKRRLHGAAGQALDDLPEVRRRERAADLVRHFLASDHPERALPHAFIAGERAVAVFAYAEAESRYCTAMDLATEYGDEAARAKALEHLGSALGSAGKSEEAVDASERAAQLYEEQGDLEGAGRAVALAGQLQAQRGEFAQGKRSVQRMLTALERIGPSPALARLYSALERLCSRSGRYTESLAAAVRAAELARTLGDQRLLTYNELNRCWTLLVMGRTNEARRVLQDAFRGAELSDPVTRMNALAKRAYFIWVTGSLKESDRLGRRALAMAEAQGDRERIARMCELLAAVHLDGGEWEQSEAYARRSVSLFPGRKPVVEGSWGIGILAEILVLQGRWEEAEEWLEDCRIFLESARYLPDEPAPRSALALRDLLDGRPRDAVDRYTGPQGAERPVKLAESSVCTSLAHLAWAHLEVGEVDEAQRAIQAALQRSTAQECIRGQVDALCIYGRVLHRQGRRQAAIETFERAVALARRLPYPFGEARTLYEWGRIEGQEPEAARRRLTDALALFQRLKAAPFVALTQEELATLA